MHADVHQTTRLADMFSQGGHLISIDGKMTSNDRLMYCTAHSRNQLLQYFSSALKIRPPRRDSAEGRPSALIRPPSGPTPPPPNSRASFSPPRPRSADAPRRRRPSPPDEPDAWNGVDSAAADESLLLEGIRENNNFFYAVHPARPPLVFIIVCRQPITFGGPAVPSDWLSFLHV